MTSRSSGSRSREGGNQLERAKALVLRVLAFHARSEAQLRTRLERAGFDPVAEEVLAWARRLGYLDDAAYARGRARALLGPGRGGPRLAERKLIAAGIPRADARQAVADALASSAAAGDGAGPGAYRAAEAVLCREALARKLRGVDPDALDPKARARAARFLLGRGFSPEVVGRVLRAEVE